MMALFKSEINHYFDLSKNNVLTRVYCNEPYKIIIMPIHRTFSINFTQKNQQNKKNDNKRKNIFFSKYLNMAGLLGVSTFLYYYNKYNTTDDNTIPYNQIFKLIECNQIESITIYKDISSSNLYFVKMISKQKEEEKEYTLYLTNIDKFISDIEEKQAEMNIDKAHFIPIKIIPQINNTSTSISNIVNLTGWSLFWYFLMRTFFTIKTKVNIDMIKDNIGFTSSRAKEFIKGNNTPITLKDIAGLNQAKKEIFEFIDFLKNPKKYHKLGAKIPHGALLVGPPGTGKTLLAKAIAGEANVPFFSISGSEFDEMYVGVGPARVRSLFSMAKERSPCILFIDEIDSVGSKRTGLFGQNDERKRTLNQLLVEMDGFNSNNKIIVLAATNRPDALDYALLRPGRFDRKIEINLPDKKEREAIFMLYLNKIKLQKQNEIQAYAKKLSKMTPGFSGADIANLVNEAAILSARQNKENVSISNFESASDRIIAGFEMKKLLSPKEKRIVAVHEAGHAVINWYLPNLSKVYKISIIPRSKGSLGYNINLPRNYSLYTKEQLMNMITGLLGGRLAEEMYLGKVTTGSYNDLQKVNDLAKEMVMKYGMSDLGLISFDNKERYSFIKPFSYTMENKIEIECQKIIENCVQKGKMILKEKEKEIRKIVNVLLEKETINYEEIKVILGNKIQHIEERKLL